MYAEKDDRSKYQKGETGDMVGTLMEPMKVAKGEALMNYDECLEIAGKSAGPPEDPNAVAPPADGSAVPLQVMLDNAITGRSKWDGKKVKVSALLFSVSTSQWTSGDKTGESTSVSLALRAPLRPRAARAERALELGLDRALVSPSRHMPRP